MPIWGCRRGLVRRTVQKEENLVEKWGTSEKKENQDGEAETVHPEVVQKQK